jgi:homocitrate synthase NifV
MIDHTVILEDTTLRDGEQTPGIAFSIDQKLAIFNALLKIGVKYIEPGIPTMGGDEVTALKIMLERKDEALLVGWNRGVREDIEASLSLGFRAIHIGLPTSKTHLEKSLGRDREWLIVRATELIKFAKDRGAFVSISAEDVGRTELSFLQEYAGAVSEAGANRLRLSDTIGIMTPEKYAERVRSVRAVSRIPVQCHCHNDFGLAIANTLAGLEAGATYFHVCVNGIGERAGMPDLAQMTMALKKFYRVDLGIDTSALVSLAALVSNASRQPLPIWQPIVGRNIFAHESGIHAKGMLKDSGTFEPFQPEEVGGERRYVVGKHSGRAVVKHILEERGVAVNEDLLPGCLDAVRRESIRVGGPVEPENLMAIYSALVNQVSPALSA